MHQALKANSYCLVTRTASYCCTDDSDPSIVRTTVIVSVATIISSLTQPPYCLIPYCPYLPRSISRAWGQLVDPSLILLSIVSYKAVVPCPLIKFDTRLSPLVFVTSS